MNRDKKHMIRSFCRTAAFGAARGAGLAVGLPPRAPARSTCQVTQLMATRPECHQPPPDDGLWAINGYENLG